MREQASRDDWTAEHEALIESRMQNDEWHARSKALMYKRLRRLRRLRDEAEAEAPHPPHRVTLEGDACPCWSEGWEQGFNSGGDDASWSAWSR